MNGKSSIFPIKIIAVAAGFLFSAPFMLGYANKCLDQYWLEEAHQAYLTTLVEARNYAWGQHSTINICPVNAAKQCVPLEDPSVIAWQAYISDDSPQAASNTLKIIAHHPFHSKYIRFTHSGTMEKTAMGFDVDGYSLHPQVIAYEISTIARLSEKNYTIVVEPSGAVQSLVNVEHTGLQVAKIAAVTLRVEG